MKILKFYSTTCGPCKVLAKTLEPVKDQITEVDIFESTDLTMLHGVRKVPVTIFLDDQDNEFARLVGTYDLGTFEKTKNGTHLDR